MQTEQLLTTAFPQSVNKNVKKKKKEAFSSYVLSYICPYHNSVV